MELVGLCASTVKWLSDLSKKNKYPFEGVAVKKPGGATLLVSSK